MSEHKSHGKHKYGPEYMSHELTVCGMVATPLCLRVADLKGMNRIDAVSVAMVCGSGTPKGEISGYSGVLLKDILEKASVIINGHHAPNRLYLKVSSKDGYLAVFSWQEIHNSVVGEKALVLFEKDGQPLGEDEGEFVFVSANDYRPGPRRMRYLSRIEVCEVS